MATNTNEARLRLTAQDETASGMASAARNMRRTADEAERSAKRISAAQERAGQARAAAFNGAAQAIAGGLGGAAAIGFAKDSYTAFAASDRYLTRIGNNAGKSSQEMQGVGKTISKIANDFALPLSTVAEGLDSLVASGRSLEDSMAFLPSVAAAAQASGASITDISASAGALGTSMGFVSSQMTKAFDILVAGGQAGNFELKDMARYLPSLAPAAAAVGYKGEEGLKKLVAILQVVRKQTGTAEEAATSVGEVFAKMNSVEMVNSFKELGNFDLKGTMEAAQKAGKDLPSTFIGFTRDVLTAAARGGDPLLKLPLLFKDKQLQQGMRALLSQPGAVKDLVAALGNVDGTTVKNLRNITEDAASQAQRLSTSWEEAKRSVGALLGGSGVPEGLHQIADDLNRSAEGMARIAKYGLGGALKRALNQASVDGLTSDRADKAKEVADASSPAEKARLEAELRELDERLALAKSRFDRADQAVSQKQDGLPPLPDLPGPLSPELTPGRNRSPAEIVPPQFPNRRNLDPMNPGGVYQPTSFGDGQGDFRSMIQKASLGSEGAQEDTQREMARDLGKLVSIWSRAVGANAPSGRFGSGISKPGGEAGASGTPFGLDAAGGERSGAGGGGGGVGPRGGSGGMPNLRYGRGGSTPSRGLGGRPSGGGGGASGGGGGSRPSGRGGSSPAEDGGAAEVAGAMNPRLAGSRKSLMDELERDPALKRDVIKTASMENRGSPAKMQAVIESMVNRSKMNGYSSLRQAIHSGFYGPVNRGGLSGGLSEKDKQDGETALKRVAGGSNAIGYRTDQGMLTDPGARRYMQEPDKSGHQVIGGENFFYMGQKGRAWAKQQQGLDAANPAASANPAAPAKPPEVAGPNMPSPNQGGTGFKPPAASEAGNPAQSERLRERSTSQARREMDRETRNARMNTYSDVGVA